MPEPTRGEMTVESARALMLTGLKRLDAEEVLLADALGRILAEDVLARRDQPPSDVASMDGYAVLAQDASDRFTVIGESAAGRPFEGTLRPGEAVRIFTGARAPDGVQVIVQERATRSGGVVTFEARTGDLNVRRRGRDFQEGAALLTAGTALDPWRLSLAAAAGRGALKVVRRPRVAILSTGDELVPAGAALADHQIVDSGTPALVALVSEAGGSALALGPAGDDRAAIAAAVAGARADLIVTLGGASVGDHDLVKPALRDLGLELQVDTVRLRPGKPTWFGRLASGRPVLGLPGNPASALVCAELFLRPMIRVLLGRPPGPDLLTAPLSASLPAGGGREHWMRAVLDRASGAVTPLSDQDSSLISVFAAADALIRRPIDAPPAAPGDLVEMLPLGRR